MKSTTTFPGPVLSALLLASLLAAAAGVEAQGRGPGPMGAARSAPRAELPLFALEHRSELRLTGAQATAMEALVEPMRAEATPLFEEMQAIRTRMRDGELDRAEARSGMDGIRQRMQVVRAAHLARVHEILTPEQRETFDRLHAARRGAGRQGPPGHGIGRRGPRGGG